MDGSYGMASAGREGEWNGMEWYGWQAGNGRDRIVLKEWIDIRIDEFMLLRSLYLMRWEAKLSIRLQLSFDFEEYGARRIRQTKRKGAL